MLDSIIRKSIQYSCLIPYEMYHPPKSGYDTLTNLRIRLKTITFILKRTVSQGEQGIFRHGQVKVYSLVM